MELTFTEEERQIRRAARDLAEDNFAENAFHWQGAFSEEHAETLADHGYLG